MTCAALHHEILTTLQWYSDHGVDIALEDEAIDRYAELEQEISAILSPTPEVSMPASASAQMPTLLGKSDASLEAVKLAKKAESLEELQQSIAGFDGIALKKTASNLVFSDGNPASKIMMIGDAPSTDEDRQGKVFVGPSGILLDRILSATGLSRSHDDMARSVYLTHLVNWRPPGNRTPSPAEMAVSLPFIERHIQLVQPDILIFLGGETAKTLLGESLSLSRLRKKWHDYTPVTQELAQGVKAIPAMVTYHPSYLLTTPIQKKSAWMDFLMLKEKIEQNQ